MMSGLEIMVSDKEAELARAAMKAGGILELGFSLINTKSIETIENTEETAIRSNRIINDENFKGLCASNGRSIDLLNSRYSGDKYEKEWTEALAYKKKLNDNDRQLSTTV